jgi:hypothetical protein
MPRYLVKIDFGDDREVRSYIVHAPTKAYARYTASQYAKALVSAHIVGERTGPKEEDSLLFDAVLTYP